MYKEIKSRNNLHSSAFLLLHLWKILHKNFKPLVLAKSPYFHGLWYIYLSGSQSKSPSFFMSSGSSDLGCYITMHASGDTILRTYMSDSTKQSTSILLPTHLRWRYRPFPMHACDLNPLIWMRNLMIWRPNLLSWIYNLELWVHCQLRMCSPLLRMPSHLLIKLWMISQKLTNLC